MSDSIILGIESSCDDTSAAIIQGNKILSNIAANQEIHNEYGGVVPELASRAHQQNIIPVVQKSVSKANIQQKDISAIGFTRGPGLLGSLLVGTSFAKSLAMSLKVPLIEVNHLQAHILAHFIDDANPLPPKFPFLCLTVSGGHTMIVVVKDYFDMEIIGKTIDDAAGEGGQVRHHQHVERVAVVVVGLGDEAVVARVVHWRVKHAIELEGAGLLMVLVLVARAFGDLDDDMQHVGHAGAGFQIMPQIHCCDLSASTMATNRSPGEHANQDLMVL